MPEALQKQSIRNLGVYGVIRQAEVDDSLIPDGAVVEAINVHFDRKGAVSSRLGLTKLNETVSTGNPALGLYDARFSNSASNAILVVFNQGGSNGIFLGRGGSFTLSVGAQTASSKTRFATFSDRVIMVNGADNMICWKGGSTSWTTTGNPINPNSMGGYVNKYIEVYKNRVYTIGYASQPDRLYFSSVASSLGVISWTPASDFVDINPNDGENATGLKRYSLELIIFKPNYLYRFRTSNLDPDPLIKIGTRSNESIIEGKKGLYFHHDTGFYRYSGGYPKEISRPISDIVNAIPYSYYDDISSWKDSDHVCWSVGDLTISGETWKNVVVRFTESSEIWTVYSYFQEIRSGAEYDNGSSLTRVVADDNGSVYTFDSGNTDNGQPIGYRVITKWYDLGSVVDAKLLQHIVGICEKAQGSEVMFQTNDDSHWLSLGQLRKFITNFEPLSIKCNRIRFKLTGMTLVEPFVFLGWDIQKGINLGFQK